MNCRLLNIIGQYDVNDEQVKASVSVPMSSFKSSTRRNLQNDPPEVSTSRLLTLNSLFPK